MNSIAMFRLRIDSLSVELRFAVFVIFYQVTPLSLRCRHSWPLAEVIAVATDFVA